uniref:Energy-coupling factor transporter transmembrane protein EcfT n=1 Tax=Fervidicoccus fontis TaxID=683846 RepID=A0A7J3ZJV6_9CREN
MLRELARAFVYGGRPSRLGLATRLLLPLLLVACLVAVEPSPKGAKPLALLASILAVELLIARSAGGIKRVVTSLKLVLLFIAIGLAIMMLARALGLPAGSPLAALVGSIRVAALVIALSLVFQWVSLRELRWILEGLGLRRASLNLSVVLVQLPLTISVFSEVITTVRLKLGRRYLSSFVKPLLYHAVVNSRAFVESFYLYGLPAAKGKPELSAADALIIGASTIGFLLLFYLVG